MRKIKRNLNEIKKAIENCRINSDKYYLPLENHMTLKCRICGAEQSLRGGVFVKIWNEYEYYQCKNCDAIVLANLPDVKKMYSEYETANGSIYIDDEVYDQRVKMISGPKVEFALEACKIEKINIHQWLDIGCGGGEILSYLKTGSEDIRAVGIESDGREVEFARKKGLKVYKTYVDINTRDEDIESLIKESDIISMFNVLEHVKNPVDFVKYLWEHMSKEAVIMFEVPRHPSVASFANQTCHYAIYRHIVPPIHLQVFSDKSLLHLLDGKFEIFAKWYFGQGYTDLINNAMIVSKLEETPLYVELVKLSNKIQPIFDEAGLSDQMLVMGKKV